MKSLEKAMYLKGLAEGIGLSDKDNKDKLLLSMIEAIEEIAREIDDIDCDLGEIADQVDALDEDLADVEDYLADEDDDDEFDSDFYEVKCPACGEEICIDEDTLDEENINCPACGELLEFDFSCGCDDDCEC